MGRQAELGLLAALLDEARQGAGRVALLGGEPGVGKTRLLRELMHRARASGAVVALGAAYEGERAPAFAPVVQALQALARVALAEAREALQSAIDALSKPVDEPGERERWSLFANVALALEAVAPESSVCLFALEDLHWADESTLHLLTWLGRHTENACVMLLGTHRAVTAATSEGLAVLLTAVRRERLGAALMLQPLAAEEATALVHAAAERSLPPEQVEGIVRRGAGNPFFLEELLRDTLVAQAGGVAPLHIPDAVADLVQLRLARLPEPTRELAAAASVAGEGVRTDQLAAVLECSEEQATGAVEDLMAEGILEARDPPRLGFRHALVRDAVYAWIPLARRRALHLRCARMIELESGADSAAAVASHLQSAGTGPALRRAAALFVVAARRSLDVLAFEEAVRQLERAEALQRELGATPAERLALALLLAEAHQRAGNAHVALDGFRRCAERAAALGDAGAEAAAALGYERTYLSTGRPRSDPDALSIPLLAHALAALGDTATPARASILAALAQAHFFAGGAARADALSVEALQTARETHDRGAEVAALTARRVVTWGPGDPAGRFALAREISSLAGAAGDSEQLMEALFWQVAAAVECGRLSDAVVALDHYATIAQRLRRPRYLATSLHMQGMLALLRGDRAAARALAQEALRQGRRAGYADAGIHYLAQTAELLEPEDPDRRPIIEQALAETSLWQPVPVRQVMLSWLLTEAGRPDEAQRTLARLAENRLADMPRDWMFLPLLRLLSEAVARLGRADWAALVYELLLPYADQVIQNSCSVCYGSAQLPLGIAAAAAGNPAATQHFRRAIERHAGLNAPLLLARSHELLGGELLRAGAGRDEARACLEQALRLYRGHDLTHASARVASKLDTTATLARVAPAGLTPREIEVLRLIAAGCSNREIAERLVLSTNTVERHITNLYAKIDARGKADATAFAIRHGITA
ncbi:MAG TPA: AAA family ATPase [Dehalococcoidia bacterium]|nr:AAA family ATPase [Dehalococcoidia bacterium]